jgi:hypothetical protein
MLPPKVTETLRLSPYRTDVPRPCLTPAIGAESPHGHPAGLALGIRR